MWDLDLASGAEMHRNESIRCAFKCCWEFTSLAYALDLNASIVDGFHVGCMRAAEVLQN